MAGLPKTALELKILVLINFRNDARFTRTKTNVRYHRAPLDHIQHVLNAAAQVVSGYIRYSNLGLKFVQYFYLVKIGNVYNK